MKIGDRVIYKPTYERISGKGIQDGDIGTIVLIQMCNDICSVKFDRRKKKVQVFKSNLQLYKEEIKMKKIISPKFMPGEVIDLSYKSNNLPNRIFIKRVRMDVSDKGWMYDILLENSGDTTAVEESFIEERMTHKLAKVYSEPYVLDLYSQGFRFAGNYDESEALKIAKSLKGNSSLLNIQIHPAFYPSGLEWKSKRAIWIRYHQIILDDGMMCKVITPTPPKVMIIK